MKAYHVLNAGDVADEPPVFLREGVGPASFSWVVPGKRAWRIIFPLRSVAGGPFLLEQPGAAHLREPSTAAYMFGAAHVRPVRSVPHRVSATALISRLVRPLARRSVLLLCLLTASAASAQTRGAAGGLRARLDSIFDRPALSNAFFGVAVADAATGEVLYTRNAERSFMPASNAKLYTTAAALDLYGADFRFTTTLHAAGPIESGTLRGDLVLRGAGDPTLGGAYFAEQDQTDRLAAFRAFADSLRARGVTRIEGAVVGDDDVFDDVALGYAWSWDDIPYYYSAEMSGLSFYDNTVDLTIQPGAPGQTGSLSWEPFNTPYVSFINRTETREAGFGVREGYARPSESNTITLTSRVGRDTRDPETLTIHNPTRYAAFILRSVLETAGITVTGDAQDADDRTAKPDYSTAVRVASWRSEPLRRIVEGVNKESINLWADQLIKLIGTREAGPRATERAPLGSHERGLAVAKAVWGRMGVDTVGTALVDGSGLSRLNLVTPASTVALLRAMHRHRDEAVRSAFRASLPIGGEDGTLKNRFREGRARGNVRAKTGSLGAVSSLGGFVTTRGGRVLAFTVMVNHYTTPSSSARSAQDDAVQMLAGLD